MNAISRVYVNFLFLVLSVFSLNTIAVECTAVFPGSKSLSTNGAASINADNTCNGGSCLPVQTFTAVSPLPTISPNGAFNSTSLSDGIYEHSSWGLSRDSSVVFNGSGTAVIYFNGSVQIPRNTKINEGGNPSSVLIVVAGSIIIDRNAQINAHIYSAGAITISRSSTINGAVSAVGRLDSDRDNDFTYDVNDVLAINPHGFCDGPSSTLLAEWRMDESLWNEGADFQVTDQTGNYDASAINGAQTENEFPAKPFNPGTCGYGRFDGSNDYIKLPDSFDNLQDSFTITAWVNPSNLDAGSRIFIDDENNEQKGFGFSLGDGGSGKLRFYSRGVNPIIVDTGVVIKANEWSFVTAVHNSITKTREIYVNGVAQPLNNGSTINTYTGDWGIDTGPATIGGETDDGETNNRFTGSIDEVRIYRGALSASEISDIYAESHACPFAPNAEWRLDELSWNNVPEEVEDSSGRGYNGTALGFGSGSADPQTDNTSPALTGNPGTCHYAEFDGVDDYVEIADGENLDNTQKLTLSTWFKADSFIQTNGTNARGLFSKRAAVSSDSSYGAFFWNGQGNRLFIDIVGNNNRFGSNTRFSLDTWYHVAIVFDGTEPVNSRVKLYVNGILDGTFAESSSFIPDTDSNFYIGNLFYSASQLKVFDGTIDEVNVLPSALTSSEVNTLMNKRRPCNSLQLFQVEHDARGLTCQSESLEITACADASCNTVDTGVTTGVDLLVNGNSQVVSIVNGRGTTRFNYRDTVTPATVSLASDYLCFNNLDNIKGTSAQACQLTFSETGFVFSNIDNQIAGVPFNGVTIQALADDNGVCTALVNDTTTIDMAMAYQSPKTRPSSGFGYTIDNAILAGNETTAGAPPLVYSDISLAFDNSGSAPINNNKYDDAGQIRLHAQFVIPGNGAEPDVTVEGSSNLFWVRPYRFDLSSDTTNVFPAGDFFTFAITAVNASGGVTTNYKNNDVELSVERTLPSVNATDGVNGNFEYQTGSFITASTTATFAPANGITFTEGIYESTSGLYSEVGAINVDVRETNYGDVGLSILSYDYTDLGENPNPILLGRFTPKYFDQTVQDNGSLIGQCGDWAYSGQKKVDFPTEGAITYGTVPQLRITARNAQGEETKNYRSFNLVSGGVESYMMLEDDDVVVELPTFDAEEDGALSTKLALTASITNKVDPYLHVSGGIHDYSFNMADHFTYTRDANALYKPFMAKFDLNITSITDSDGVQDGNNAGINSASLSPVLFRNNLLDPLDPSSLLENTVEIKYGRLVLENSYGPETSALPQVFRAEYLADHLTNSFVVHEDDSCTQILNLPGNWLFNNGDGLTSADINFDSNSASGLLSAGEFSAIAIESKKINNMGKQGAIGVIYTTPAWLQFAWPAGVNANAIATFGQYRGNDRIIYWRELRQ